MFLLCRFDVLFTLVTENISVRSFLHLRDFVVMSLSSYVASRRGRQAAMSLQKGRTPIFNNYPAKTRGISPDTQPTRP